MKILKKTYLAVLWTIVAMAMTSCGGDDPTPINQDASDRAYLEETATLFMQHIRPIDQATLLESLSTFVKMCKTYKFPDNFYDNRVDDLARSAEALYDAIENNDWMMQSRAATDFIYNMARFQGMYQANVNIEEWQFIEARDHVNFRFWRGNDEYNIILQGIGGEWTATVPENYANYVFEVPKKLQLLMYPGNNIAAPIVSVSVDTDGKDNDHLKVNYSGRMANVEIWSTTDGTNTKFTEDITIFVHNTYTMVRTEMLKGTVTVTGNNLCSIAAWNRLAHSADFKGEVAKMLGEANTTMHVLQRVTLKSRPGNLTDLINNIDATWKDRNSAVQAATSLTSSMTGGMYYFEDQSKQRASLGWEAYQPNDDPDSQVWAIRPTLTFASDQATYDFSSFFGNGRFLSVETNFKSLLSQYKNLWR